MKILYVTTLAITINSFLVPHIQMLLEEGNIVDIACNVNEPVKQELIDCGVRAYDIPFTRSPLSQGNISAYKQLKTLIVQGNYDLVHCHTPNAAAVTRLACRKLRKNGLKVFYSAHGFHFYKGAPLKNWLLYYPVEWLCAHWTDTLITTNKEDYERAQKFAVKKVRFIPGVGIDTAKFAASDEERMDKRRAILKQYNVPADATILLSVGEVNRNKNHRIVIQALPRIDRKDVYYFICGRGPLMKKHKALARRLGIEERVILTGYRSDVADFYKTAVIFVFPSIREGLGLAALEAMELGLPIVAAKNRGTTEYVVDNVNGYLCDAHSIDEFVLALDKLIMDVPLKIKFGKASKEAAMPFRIDNVQSKMKQIYEDDMISKSDSVIRKPRRNV